MSKFEIVYSEYGQIKGVHKNSVLGTDYISFQGIPYMAPPLGKLRFRDAVPPNTWDIFDATGEAKTYCAINMLTLECEGEEDSGVLNVFTKNLDPSKLYPVMIWVLR